MRTLDEDALPCLPAEVKSLVRDGVYALYRLRTPTASGGTYVLLTHGPKESYLLAADGDPVLDQVPTNIVSEVAEAITFGGAGETQWA